MAKTKITKNLKKYLIWNRHKKPQKDSCATCSNCGGGCSGCSRG